MANVFKKGNILYTSDIKPHIGLRGAIMSPIFKNTIEKAYLGCLLETLGKQITKLIWKGTRDTTMVIFTTALLVDAEASQANGAVTTLVDDLQQKNKDDIKKLFEYMGSGNGSGIKSKLEKLANFKKLFKAIVGEGLKVEKYTEDNKIDKIWQGYLNQMDKIKPWKLSAGTVEKHVLPILEASLKDQYYDAFKKGFESTKKSNIKKYDKIIKEALSYPTTFKVRLSPNGEEVELSPSSTKTFFTYSKTVSKESNGIIALAIWEGTHDFNIQARQKDLHQLIHDNNITDADGLRKLINDAIQKSSDEIAKIIVTFRINTALDNLQTILKVSINDLYNVQYNTRHGILIDLLDEPFKIQVTRSGTLYVDLESEEVPPATTYFIEERKIVDSTAIQNELKQILQPLVNIIHLIHQPPAQELTQNVPPNFAVTFEHYDYEKNDKIAVKCEKTGNTPIFYCEFADHSDDCTIYLYPEGIYELARQEDCKLQPVIQTLQEKIVEVTSQQEGVVLEEGEQQL